MRIKLKKGYQKKLIHKAKLDNNYSWDDLSKMVSLNKLYLALELYNEKRILSEEVYVKLSKIASVDYDKYIEKKLEDNWGRAKGGKNSTKEPKILLKNYSIDLAELIGVILGDGNLYILNNDYYVRICGDLNKDKDYLLNYINPLFEKLFSCKMNIIENTKNNELILSKGSKDIVFTLIHFGLIPGNKKVNNVGIPKWIFSSNEYLKVCIRGLIDTDGSLSPITGRDYPYIWFSSNIENIRNDFSKAMKQLGFKTSKWNIREGRTPDIYIGSKDMIWKYIQTISFKNHRHFSKLDLNASVV